jgi:hypothetical protein
MVAIFKKVAMDEEEDFFLMANLRQKTTGLPMVIWVSEHGDAKHGARIKVSTHHSEKINIHETVSISIAESPEIVAGQGLNNRDLQLVAEFIGLNKPLLLDYWNSEIDTSELITGLVKLPQKSIR